MRLLIETRDASLGVEDGVIVPLNGPFDLTLRIRDGTLYPGLINAHDHLHRNHYGRLGHPPYEDAYEWGRDIHHRCAETIARGRALPRREALLRGAWKNLRAGVTTVVHHDAWESEFDEDFPLRVVRIDAAHSLRLAPTLPQLPTGGPFTIHLAEGVNAASADEVRELDARGLLTSDLLAVHVVGVDARGIKRLRSAGVSVVWCPSSNRFLFGRTCPAELLAPGIDVLLGSDSLLTADGSLLHELRVARAFGVLSHARLCDAVGITAARRLGLEPPSLAVGARADVIVLRRPLLDATEADVALVIANGVLRVLSPSLVGALGPLASGGTIESVAGVPRWISAQSPRVESEWRGRDEKSSAQNRVAR
jgi:cytosine/adenosine deaminase-related metal-dependent hydrolase